MNKKCDRCHKNHRRLLRCWDNEKGEDTLICCSCVAEIAQKEGSLVSVISMN